MELLLNGIWTVLQPINLMMIILGTVLGIIIGILPGVGGAMGVALIIPFTFQTEPIRGILVMVALYVSSTYGGSITSILFKIPGETPSIVTTFDGYELTKKGEAGKALGTAIFSSCLGGIFAVIVMIFITPHLSNIALSFGEAEYFAMAMLGLSVCTGIGGGSVKKNALSAFAGLFLATWGIDQIAGNERFTFGLSGLLMGITIVPAAIGMFAIGEVFEHLSTISKEKEDDGYMPQGKVKVGLPPFKEILRMKWLFLRSAVVGTFLGALPGVGATTASFFGYSEAVRWSRHPEKFGTGLIDGVAAPETANNAACSGAMVPLITLGIPGSVVTAVMMGAFLIHGIRPGPMMIYQQGPLVYSIFAGLLLSNVLIIAGGLLGIKYIVKVLDVSYSKIGATIVLLAIIGSYALRNSLVDVWITFGFGILSFFMRKYGYGLAPMVLGMILGPLAETSLHRAMIIANYDPMFLISRPISASLLALAAFSLFYPFIRKLIFRNTLDKHS